MLWFKWPSWNIESFEFDNNIEGNVYIKWNIRFNWSDNYIWTPNTATWYTWIYDPQNWRYLLHAENWKWVWIYTNTPEKDFHVNWDAKIENSLYFWQNGSSYIWANWELRIFWTWTNTNIRVWTTVDPSTYSDALVLFVEDWNWNTVFSVKNKWTVWFQKYVFEAACNDWVNSHQVSIWSNQKIQFKAVAVNEWWAYDATNSRFVAPVDWYYQFNVNVEIKANNTWRYWIAFRKNWTTIAQDIEYISQTTQWQNASFSRVFKLNAWEYIEVWTETVPSWAYY